LHVASLSSRELARRLRGPGLRIRTGPMVVEVRSGEPAVLAGIATLYADFEVVDADRFADLHVSVRRPRNPRRWLRPQVRFLFDGVAPFDPLPASQAYALFEWGLNWSCSNHLHQYLILHAAVLERDGRALVLPAPPGAGKSTLCAALAQRGWRLLSDEMAIFRVADMALLPNPRPVSLKNASIGVIAAFAPDAVFSAVVHDTQKGDVAYLRPPADSVARAACPARARWVVAPRYVAGAPAALEPLSRARGLLLLIESAFNANAHGQAGFERLGDVARDCDFMEFTYGDLGQAMRAFERLAAPGEAR
jgi:hypothetical protein